MKKCLECSCFLLCFVTMFQNSSQCADIEKYVKLAKTKYKNSPEDWKQIQEYKQKILEKVKESADKSERDENAVFGDKAIDFFSGASEKNGFEMLGYLFAAYEQNYSLPSKIVNGLDKADEKIVSYLTERK